MAPTNMFAHPVDLHVGSRIAEGRRAAALSQARLALSIGVSLPALQAYEAGRARVGALTLFRLCEVLDRPLGYFYHGLTRTGGVREQPAAFEGAPSGGQAAC